MGSRASNSKPILPSGCLTRKALKLRPVRDDLNPVSRSVLPSVSSLPICSRLISCCRMILPVVKSQLLGLVVLFSQTYFMPCSNTEPPHFGQVPTGSWPLKSTGSPSLSSSFWPKSNSIL
ncbi:hypothetical protein D9M72_371930 [compost metagenome]